MITLLCVLLMCIQNASDHSFVIRVISLSSKIVRSFILLLAGRLVQDCGLLSILHLHTFTEDSENVSYKLFFFC